MENKRMHHTTNEGEKNTVVRGRMGRFVIFTAMVILLAAALPTSAAAEETTQPEGWQVGADVYLWMAGIGGETAGFKICLFV